MNRGCIVVARRRSLFFSILLSFGCLFVLLVGAAAPCLRYSFFPSFAFLLGVIRCIGES